MKRYIVQFTLTIAEARAIKADERNDRNAFERQYGPTGYSFHVEFEPINDKLYSMDAYVFTDDWSEAATQAKMEKLFNKKADFANKLKGY